MQISKHKMASFEFTVTDENGEILDSSEDTGPFYYVQGTGNLIPGLESAMEGKSAGDSFKVSVPPAQGYGEWDETLLMDIPRSAFGEVEGHLEVGQLLQMEDQGGVRLATVCKVEDDKVTLDGNHPMAGMTLNFDITVVDVRDATEDELDHCYSMNHHDCACNCNDNCCN